MSEHTALVSWTHKSGDVLKGTYSREHTWTFDGGAVVRASPALSSVRPPYSNPAFVDPEEALVASISSCHMLTFIWLASRAGFEVASYDDNAVGVLTKNEAGVSWLSAVTLRPRIVYKQGRVPSPEEEEHLHHQTHAECSIANSVKAEIRIDAVR
jgi:organic hydroperoxide reductase OsmC/OhrA